MHIPSKRVYKEIKSEIASLWYVPVISDEVALIVKAPTSTIKALTLGCPIELLFGKIDNYLCNSIKIFDIPDAPVIISGLQKELEEHQSLIKCLKRKKFPIFLFNEMDICVAWSELMLTDEDSYRAISFIGNEKKLYVGDFDDNASHILDCFCYSTDTSQEYQNAHFIPIVEVFPSFSKWETNNNYFYGNNGYKNIIINDIDEGENFEKTIWSVMASIFPSAIYKSPQVQKGKKTRELTDVLTYYKYGAFLIEVKDSSVIQAGNTLNQDKRLSNIQKQVKKAIKQLSGAAKAFMHKATIYDNDGNELSIDRSQPPHCIILITEFLHSGDWREIQQQIYETFTSTGAFFNVLDLRELMTIIKQSSGRPEIIDYNLMQRCKMCMENHEIFIRGK